MKQMVLESLPGERTGVSTVMQHSEQEWEYDPDGNWLMSEETIATINNEAEAIVVVNRPLGVDPIKSDTFLLAKHIMPLAYENHNDKLCVPRQMAHIMNVNICEIMAELNSVGGQENVGYSLATIIQYCQKERLRCVCINNNEILERIDGDIDLPIIAFFIHADHA